MSQESINSANLLEKQITPEEFAKNQQIYADVVAKYYGDPQFKAKVDANPTKVLKAEGFYLPDGAKVKLLFNDEKLVHIVLPAPVA
jgi:hypothetical protein